MAEIKRKIASFLGLVTKEELEKIEEEKKTYERLFYDISEKANLVSGISETAITDNQRESTGNKSKIRKTPKQCFNLYLTNQFIYRGVNVKADEVVSRGYKIFGEDQEGVESCKELLRVSGGSNFIRTLTINTDVGGDGYVEKVLNKAKNKFVFLKIIHPVTFGFETDEKGNIVLDSNKQPKAYQQVIIDENGMETVKKGIPKERIAHLRFNIIGDEFNGVSSLQSIYNTAVRLMNMEQAAAEAAVRTANPLWVGYTDTKNINEIRKWSTLLGNISGASQLFIPKGMELKMMSPGPQNFNDYADYFLDAVVAALGVPRAILLGEAKSGSRAQSIVLSRHFYSSIRSMQRYIEDMFNNDIFPHYAKIAGFKAPTFKFNDVAEDAEVNGQMAIEMFNAGIISREEARQMIGLEGSTPSFKQTVTDAVKKTDMKTWHPSNGLSPAGSQKGVKSKQKYDPTVKSVK